jgi:hypothetical protein
MLDINVRRKMRTICLSVAIVILASLALWRADNAFAATPTANLSVTVVPGTGTNTGPVGVPPPAGYHWVQTFDDEFTQDSSINTNTWTIETECQQYGGPPPSLDSTNGLGLRAGGVSGNSCGRTGIVSNNGDQRFGYWEWSMKLPKCTDGSADGKHPDVWFRPTLDDGGEIDVTESDMGTGNCTYVNFVVHDTCGNCNSINIYWPQTVELADAFHTYGFYWHQDATAHGSAEVFFDGVSQNTPSALQNSTWDEGINERITLDGCVDPGGAWMNGAYCDSSTSNFGNPWYIQYERVWQLAPN